ncbi:MAG: type II secretion system major pseudopilin GspG [Deltaproteobacteria bacterium]|nr:type II secretion system major pseudopilin GspG [Deltaproteobacteria bacterium]
MKKHALLRSSQSGFSFLELLAALTILAIVVGIAAPAIFKNIAKGKTEAAKVEIASLEQALNSFNLDCGFFPSTEQGLDALIHPPTVGRPCKNYDAEGYLKKKSIPEDPFKQNYVYVSPGKHNPSSYDLYSIGSDNLDATEDDITNW